MKTWVVLGMLSLVGVAQAAGRRRADDPAPAPRSARRWTSGPS